MTTEPTFSTSDDKRRLEARVTFNADAPLTLSASNASGRVDVTTDATLPAGTLHVAAVRTDNGEFEEGDHHLSVRVEGNAVSIHPDWQFASGVSGLARRIRDQLQFGFRPEDWNLSRLRLSPELDFHIIVRLPANLADGSQIKLRTASGEVDARSFRAGASIITASGDVEARDLTGTISIHTASGDVEAANIVESLEVNTASGDIAITGGDAWLAARSASGDVQIRDFTLRNARVTTVSGDVHIRATFNNTANYGVETVSGDVSLDTVLPGAAAKLGFGTLSGSSDVGGQWEKQKRREWTAGTGASGATINVKTVSGDLSARARVDDTVEARSMAMPRHEEEPMDEFSDQGFADIKEEMKAFGKEMKQFGKEMKHMGHRTSEVVPPVPPKPPLPPMPPRPPMPPMPAMPPSDDEDAMADYEEAMRDYEQRVGEIEEDYEQLLQDREENIREIEQDYEDRLREREDLLQEHEEDRHQRREERQAAREQRQAEREREREARRTERRQEREQRRQERDERPADVPPHIFTAGPAGVDFRRDTTPLAPEQPGTSAQPTEPVAPTPSFSEEQQTAVAEPSRGDAGDPRLRVLEALEKGEIDIEDALAQLDRESGNA